MVKTLFLPIESLPLVFLHCLHIKSILSTFFGDLQSVDVNIKNFPDNEIVKLLFYCGLKAGLSPFKKFVLFASKKAL